MKERSLSDYWRESSDDRVLELISVLNGARNLIGLMGSGLQVRWSGNGMSYTDFQGHVVALDYAPLAPPCRAPFPGSNVDEVIGYAAHEGGHCLFSQPGKETTIRNQMDYHANNRTSAISPRFRRAWLDGERNPLPDGKGGFVNPVLVELCQLQNILEDAYVDNHVGAHWEVLGEHIKVARARMKARDLAAGGGIDLDAIALQARPSRSEMTTLWVNISLYGAPRPRRASRRVREALDFLIAQTETATLEDNAWQRQSMTFDVGNYLFQHFPELRPQQANSGQQGTPQPGQSGQGTPSPGQGDDGHSVTDDSRDSRDSDQAEAEGSAGAGDETDGDDSEERGQNASGQSDPGPDDSDEEAPAGKDDILRRLMKALEQRALDKAEAEADPEDQGDSDSEGEGDVGGQSATPSQQPGDGAGDAPGLPDDPDGFDGRDPMEVPEEILEAIAEALELELQDLTQEVAEILDLPPHLVAAQAKKARYDQRKAQATASRVQKQVAEVRRVFDQQNQTASRQLKGLERGKVDSRRLARVGAGDLHVFQRKQVLGQPDMDVGLVLDVSGSMNSYLRVVDETAAVFAEALSHKQGVSFAAWAYTGGQAKVQLTRLCDRQMGKLHLADVEHGGGTPSGAAIAACKVLMDRMASHRKLLLHFTDGDPDSHYHVETAVKECRKAGLAVHCIALYGVSQSRLDYQYGRGNWQIIQRVPDLPRAVMEILKQLD